MLSKTAHGRLEDCGKLWEGLGGIILSEMVQACLLFICCSLDLASSSELRCRSTSSVCSTLGAFYTSEEKEGGLHKIWKVAPCVLKVCKNRWSNSCCSFSMASTYFSPLNAVCPPPQHTCMLGNCRVFFSELGRAFHNLRFVHMTFSKKLQ